MATTGLLPERYRGPQPVGKGGMGEIFRATDSTLGRAVAIKILAERYSEDEDVRGRFTREALAAARLSGDPHIVTIYDVGEHADRPYIVMEYMSGGSLEDRLGAGRVDLGDALRWLDDAAQALDHAHTEGVVHRDVKPGNLLLDRDGNVHVADFGIASAAGMDSLTMTGTIMGTAGYLSPEQAQGERATPASDRYALAIVAFELLTGSRPYEGESITAEASAHVNAEVPSAAERNAQLPAEVDEIFRKALEKDPRERYATGSEFVAALRDALHRAAGETRIVAPAPPTRRTPPVAGPRPVRRTPAPLGLLLLGGLAAAVIAGILLAVLLSGGGDEPKGQTVVKGRTVVKTITAEGTTVRETVTQSPPTTTAPAAPAEPSSSDGHTLNDQGYAKVQAGDYNGALPLLQQAVQALQGTGPADPYEGYANYNLGYTLYRLGRCDEAVTYLSRAEQLEPDRHEPRQIRKKAEKC